MVSALALGWALLITPISASAVVGPSLTGHVSGTLGGMAISVPNVTVTLFGNDGLEYASTVTDGSGLYTFANVAPGIYQLYFFSPADSDPFAPVWLGDVTYRLDSSYLQVTSTSISGLDATLPAAGTISGTIDYSSAVADANKTARATAFLFNESTQAFQPAGDPVPVDANGDYTIHHLNQGNYAVRFDGATLTDLNPVYWQNGAPAIQLSTSVAVAEGQDISAIDQTVEPSGLQTVRLAGSNRYATAVAVSQALYPDPGSGIDTLWIANGQGFPDALSAGPAAATESAPLLLVMQNQIPPIVLAEIQRLNPTTIDVAGGTGVISAAVFAQLNALAGNQAVRLGGSNRYATSRLIVDALFGGAGAWSVTLADGRNFPDALAAGPAISRFGNPVILVDGSANAPDAATLQLLSKLGTVSVTLAGGTGVISSQMEQSLLNTPGIFEVIRDGGSNRYETANALNRRAFPSADAVFLATGAGFADALAGGTAASDTWSPLFLVQKDCIPENTMSLIVSLRPKVIFLLGGTGVLSTAIDNLTVCGGGSSGFSRTVLGTSDAWGSSDGSPSDLLQQLRSANGWQARPAG